ncbi:MAG: 4-alpha-glucanotransferase [bacterium]
MKRASGILMPIASLPNRFGIGDFGPETYKFVDLLKQSRQSYWEILPLQITDTFGSPFASPSAFAGNWMLISPEMLLKDRLIAKQAINKFIKPVAKINYHRINMNKRILLGLSWDYFKNKATDKQKLSFNEFKITHQAWLADYSAYMAIKDHYKGKPWYRWPKDLRHCNQPAIKRFFGQYSEALDFFAYGQWLFQEQWCKLKYYTNQKGINIIGDLPYAIAYDSVDVWASRNNFQVTKDGLVINQVGAPPDSFNKKGQIWGAPAYDWSYQEKHDFDWQIRRFKKAAGWYDIIRLDHFRGYQAFWQVSGKLKTAGIGKWQKVPGDIMFKKLSKQLPLHRLIAEDLGFITDEVIRLREKTNIPGMRILQFGMNNGKTDLHYPKNYPKNCVAYTGTHDLPTLKQWFNASGTAEKWNSFNYARSNRQNIIWGLIKALLYNQANLVLLPLQDILELGPASRINTPGTTKNNWQWCLNSIPKTTNMYFQILKKETLLSKRG